MMTASTWLAKLIFSHLMTDFVLQPARWVEDRREKHFASLRLYLHGLVTALTAWCLIGWSYWGVALIILTTHTVIDGWKSYQERTPAYFVIDQLLHLAVIAGCWYFTFYDWNNVRVVWDGLSDAPHTWILIAAFA